MAERTVLVLEDEPATLRVLSDMLVSGGYKVIGAADGMAALRAVRQHHPALAVVDLGVPGLNGFQFIAMLKRDQTMKVPILVVTGRTNESDHQAARAAGADGLLAKPVRREDLLAWTQEHLAPDNGSGGLTPP